MRVIGAGLPRTGTSSLRDGLRVLLGGPVYHMSEAIAHPVATANDLHGAGRQLLAAGDEATAMEVFQANFDRFAGAWPTEVGMARGLSEIGRHAEVIADRLDNQSLDLWCRYATDAAGLFGLVADYAIARSGRGVARDLRMQLMDKYLHLPGTRFDDEPVPSMLTRLGTDSEQVAQAAVDALKVMVSNTLGIIGTLAIMFWTSWRVSLVLLLLAPLMALMMGKVGQRYRRLNHAIQESASDMLQTADQALNAQQDVKAYGAQSTEMARYGAQTLKNLRLALKIEVTRGTLSMLVQVLGAVGVNLGTRFLASREATIEEEWKRAIVAAK